MVQVSEKTIERRVVGKGQGWVFSERDFGDLAGRSTVASALHRLVKKGKIRPVIRGLYERPKFSKALGRELSPDIDQAARALGRKFGWRIQPGGAMAANLLGLSTQVPSRALYLSDGPDRTYKIGTRTLIFEHTALKNAGFRVKESGLVVHALRFLGMKRVTPEVMAQLRRQLPPELRRKILADTLTATGWIRAVLQDLAKEEVEGGGLS